MTLTTPIIEAIKDAAMSVEFGSVTIKSGTDNHIDIIVEKRIRLPRADTDTGKTTKWKTKQKA